MERINSETMGMRIKKQRCMLGMTQDNLSELLCIPKATISAYENDNIDIKASRLVELARALCTTPDYLLGFMDDENVENKEISKTIMAIMGKIKDEKVKKLLLEQMKVTAVLYA